MYDGWKIILGLIVFLIIVTLPFTMSIGKIYVKPEPNIDTPEIQKMEKKQCIEPKQYMREMHIKILDSWKSFATREGRRVYVATDGKTYTISLQNTCMKCHSNKEKFCDECHNYANVKPYCWDCHIEPKAGGGK